MKKTLLAIAVIGAYAGIANAQTAATAISPTVTLYGVMDAGIVRSDPSAGSTSPITALTSGNRNGGRFGFRGSEPVGADLNVIFTAEAGMNLDNGTSAQGNRLFGRQIFVGLQGGWGEVRLGRQMDLGFDFFGAIDPYGEAYNDAGMQTTFSATDAQRLDNMLMYRTAIYGGLQAAVGYSFNVGAGVAPATQQEVPGFQNNQSAITAGVFYNSGPIVFALSYESFNCPANQAAATNAASCSATRHSDQHQYQIGATYDLKLVKFAAAYGVERNAYSTFTTINGLETIAGAVHNLNTPDSENMMLGATIPLGPGRALAILQRRIDQTNRGVTSGDIINTAADNARAAAGESLSNSLDAYAVGYEYDLSKRTILWAYASQVDGKQNLNQSTAFDRRQYGVGIRHLF